MTAGRRSFFSLYIAGGEVALVPAAGLIRDGTREGPDLIHHAKQAAVVQVIVQTGNLLFVRLRLRHGLIALHHFLHGNRQSKGSALKFTIIYFMLTDLLFLKPVDTGFVELFRIKQSANWTNPAYCTTERTVPLAHVPLAHFSEASIFPYKLQHGSS